MAGYTSLDKQANPLWNKRKNEYSGGGYNPLNWMGRAAFSTQPKEGPLKSIGGVGGMIEDYGTDIVNQGGMKKTLKDTSRNFFKAPMQSAAAKKIIPSKPSGGN